MKRTDLAVVPVAVLLLLAVVTTASADVMTFDGLGLKATVTIHCPGTLADGKRVPTGEYLVTYQGQQHIGFCVDLNHYTGNGEVTELGLDTLNMPGDYRGEKLAWLYETYAWTLDSGTSAAGLSVAIWEVVNELTGNPLDPTSGQFSISGNAAVAVDATGKLAGVPDRYEPTMDLMILHSPTKQDMLIGTVPEPGALALLALGGVVQLVRRRR
ncbi:MAG: PEP-CTERM sorting domain-containing protein [Planctomycetota bacterium]|jgi:hypothetical protein